MAGVDYQVNIKLNAKPLDTQLGNLEKRVNDLKKNLAAPLRAEERAAKQAAASAKEQARLADRAAAAQVTRINLGQRLNRLEEKGLDVSKGRTIINRSLKAYEEGRIQTARAQNSLARTYITQLERQLKMGVKTGRMQAENIDASVSARERRYALDQKIRRLEEDGVNTDKIRARFGDMTVARTKKEFGLFNQIARELELTVRKERDKLALQKRQTRELERQAKLAGGAVAGGLGLRRLASGATPLISRLEQITAPAGQLALPSTQMLKPDIKGIQRIETLEDQRARHVERRAAAEKRSAAYGKDILKSSRASAKAGERSAKAAEKESKERAKTAASRLQGVALGAGFPLLFGGGPGAILGGAAGGLVGGPGGFAAQIGLSALGQQFDLFTEGVVELGQALNPLTADVDKIIEKTGLVGTKTAAYIKELEDAELSALALEAATTELALVVGDEGVDALKTFGNEALRFQNEWSAAMSQMGAALAEFLGPAVKGITDMLQNTNALRAAARSSDVQLQKLSRDYEEARRTGILFGGGPEKEKEILDQIKVRLEEIKDIERARIKLRGELEKTTEKHLDSLEKIEKLLDKTGEQLRSLINDTYAQQEAAMKGLTLKQLEYDLVVATTAEDKTRLKFDLEREKLVQAHNTAMDKSLSIVESQLLKEQLRYDLGILKVKQNKEEAENAQKFNDLVTKGADEEIKKMHDKISLQYKLNEAQDQQLQLANSISYALGQGMAQTFEVLTNGAQQWGTALRDIATTVLRDIARQLIQIYVIEQAVSFMKNLINPSKALFAPGLSGSLAVPGILPGIAPIGALADGGPAKAGSTYLVGERGPELFTPKQSGTVIPNNAIGGSSITVNVDASGSNVEGDGKQAKALGSAIALAVQNELVKQKKPGGLLY